MKMMRETNAILMHVKILINLENIMLDEMSDKRTNLGQRDSLPCKPLTQYRPGLDRWYLI